MMNEFESEKMLIDFYQAQKEAFVAKMKTEDDERSNVKFKIASLVIYELTHSFPSWFQNHFLVSLVMNDRPDFIEENVMEVEMVFYEVVADYLLVLEKEVDYVKKVMANMNDEPQKREFWQAIVADAFLIVGIYFCPTLQSRIYEKSRQIQKKEKKAAGKLFSLCLPVSRPSLAAVL